MTHPLTQEAEMARANAAANRAAARDTIINSLFNPYTFLSLLLVLGGVALALMDAKGVPLLVIACVLAAVLRLLWTIREELRASNQARQESAALMRRVLERQAVTQKDTAQP